MERTPISFTNKEAKFVISSSENKCFSVDLASVNQSATIVVENDIEANVLLLNIHDDSDLNFEIKDNGVLKLAILGKNGVKSFKITANVGYKSTFRCYFADFINGKTKGEVFINLNKQYANCDWHLASLSENSDDKVFDVSAYHNAIDTYAQLDNYGVCRDKGRLTFSGICQIIKGSHGSKAHQNAKIMVFDELSNGIAKPILKIDENDIEASHAAVVGKINDEHIFYLTSRGLTVDEAKRLITLGYLKPILVGFDNEDKKEEIEKIIEGKM